MLTYDELTSTPLNMFQVHRAADEAVLHLPALGGLSMRNLVILGIFFGIAFLVFEHTLSKITLPDDLSGPGDIPAEFIIAMVGVVAPAATGLILACTKTAFGSADAMLLNAVLMWVRPAAKKQGGGNAAASSSLSSAAKSGSRAFGAPSIWHSTADSPAAKKTASAANPQGSRFSTIIFDEPNEPHVHMLTVMSGGRLAGAAVVKVYQNDMLIEYGRRTSAAGEIEVELRTPSEPGIHELRVCEYYSGDLLMQGRVRFVRGGQKDNDKSGRR